MFYKLSKQAETTAGPALTADMLKTLPVHQDIKEEKRVLLSMRSLTRADYLISDNQLLKIRGNVVLIISKLKGEKVF